MLTDPIAIEIIANAKQKNVRDPKRSRKHFNNIYSDFFKKIQFDGSYLDMGPGQYDFGVIAQERGAKQIHAIEYDPAVIKLGEYLGFKVIEGNIKKFSRSMTGNTVYDGIFNKFSYNCFWFLDNHMKHETFVKELRLSIKPEGWAWIAPWNGVPKTTMLSDVEIKAHLLKQQALFCAEGFRVINLSDKEAKIYGIHGIVANNVVFTFGLT